MQLAVNIPTPEATRPIVIDDSTMYELFREWTRQMTNEVNARSLLIGTGSPEGVVTANIGTEYMDDAGTASAIKYIKKTGTGNTGWILI